MPERLTEHLIRRGLLDPNRVRDATQRQVLLGGALDTCLLELGLVDEAALLDEMATAYGMPTAMTREVVAPVDPKAIRMFPESWAKKHLLAPLSYDAEKLVLTVLSPAPADTYLLARLSELLEISIQPVLTAEFRVHQRLALLYEERPPERFHALLSERSSARPPVKRPVEDDAPRSGLARRPRLDFADAILRLKEARGRDDIVRTALAYAANELEYVAIFIVHETRLTGWAATGTGVENIQGVEIPLAAESAFRVVIETQAHYLGPLPEDRLHTNVLSALGRSHPRAALILPIRLKNRTIALLFGEDGNKTIAPRLSAELMIFTTHMQNALEQLLMRRKVDSLSELSRSNLDTNDLSLPPTNEPAFREPPPLMPPTAGNTTPAQEKTPIHDMAPVLARTLLAKMPVEAKTPVQAMTPLLEYPAQSAPLQVTEAPTASDALSEQAESLEEIVNLQDISETTGSYRAVKLPDDVARAPDENATPIRKHNTDYSVIPNRNAVGAIEVVPARLIDVVTPEQPDPDERLVEVSDTSGVPQSYQDLRPNVGSNDLLMSATLQDFEPPQTSTYHGVALGRVAPMAAREGDGWDPVEVDNWDSDTPAEASADLSAEAWIRASSENGTKTRTIPPEVLERAKMLAPQPEPVVPSNVIHADPPEEAPIELVKKVIPEEVTAPLQSVPGGMDIERLVLELDRMDLAARREAKEKLIALGALALPKLMENFPGRVLVEPFAPMTQHLPWFIDCGDLLAVLGALGPEAHPHILKRLDNPDPKQRFFATYFYSARFEPEAIPRLTQRLHDEESRICSLAARTLFEYRDHPEFASVLEHLHGRLEATSVAARKHAAYLLGLFRDSTSIPLFIQILERKDKAMFEAVEEALGQITKQRLGTNPKKWQTWWTKHKDQHRIAWLVEGLSGKDAEIRRSASDELRSITGADFGYDEDSPKKNREIARLKWVRWWNEQAAREPPST